MEIASAAKTTSICLEGLSKCISSKREFVVSLEEFSDCWESILKKYEKHVNSQEILHVVVFGLWSLWKTRNSAVFEGTITNPTIMVISLQAQVQEYRVAQMSTKPLINELPCPQDCAQSVPNSWTKPAHGWVKANCDRAWLKQTQKGGAG
ncbi:unnamed protein product [Prunus armeniaca]|uniref:Uncharacterized protein n=1 Tax=Prunus armeniaca TaxID=36596 RepID=A0A6J5VX66_PRUAR|nr:unnamed protein product [Prunus armeniaca]